MVFFVCVCVYAFNWLDSLKSYCWDVHFSAYEIPFSLKWCVQSFHSKGITSFVLWLDLVCALNLKAFFSFLDQRRVRTCVWKRGKNACGYVYNLFSNLVLIESKQLNGKLKISFRLHVTKKVHGAQASNGIVGILIRDRVKIQAGSGCCCCQLAH